MDGPCDRLATEDWTERVHAANHALFDLMGRDPNAQGLGTTIVGAVLSPLGITCFNVGDNWLYRFGRGGILRLSVDDVPA